MQILKNLVDLKSLVGTVVGILITLATCYTYIDNQVEQWSEKFTDKMYEDLSTKLRQDSVVYEYFTGLSYEMFEYGLLKQLEKVGNDPDDIKDMDLLLYSSVCDKNIYFNLQYIPESNNSRGLRIACEEILELSDKRYNVR